eukprot:PhM_4_TR2453/c0_g1_i1/m.65010
MTAVFALQPSKAVLVPRRVPSEPRTQSATAAGRATRDSASIVKAPPVRCGVGMCASCGGSNAAPAVSLGAGGQNVSTTVPASQTQDHLAAATVCAARARWARVRAGAAKGTVVHSATLRARVLWRPGSAQVTDAAVTARVSVNLGTTVPTAHKSVPVVSRPRAASTARAYKKRVSARVMLGGRENRAISCARVATSLATVTERAMHSVSVSATTTSVASTLATRAPNAFLATTVRTATMHALVATRTTLAVTATSTGPVEAAASHALACSRAVCALGTASVSRVTQIQDCASVRRTTTVRTAACSAHPRAVARRPSRTTRCVSPRRGAASAAMTTYNTGRVGTAINAKRFGGDKPAVCRARATTTAHVTRTRVSAAAS